MTCLAGTSYNVKGLNVQEKRTKLLAELWRFRCHIVFLQEPHFKRGKIPKLGNRRFPIVYHHASPDLKSKGVLILLSSQLPWKEIH